MRRLRRAARAMPHGRSAVLLIVAMFASVVAAALAHVSLRLGVIRLGYAITEHTRERHALEDDNRKLRIELSLLRNPARIERLARDKLNMKRPEPGQIRVVHAPRPAARTQTAPAATAPAVAAREGGSP